MNSSYVLPTVAERGLVLILGLGLSGVAAARWCARCGNALRLADTRSAPSGAAELRAAGLQADWRLGLAGFGLDLLQDARAVVLSPGLAPDHPGLADLLADARARGIEVLGEIELFARAMAALRAQGYAPKIAAITGTNGKTTVTSMLRHLARACGKTALAAGNIAPPALAALQDALDKDALPQVWALELSSFQLETTTSLAVDAATVLNISQDHLDWHGSLAAYAQAKARLLQMTRLALINRDDPLVTALPAPGVVHSFGASKPQSAGDLGLVWDNGLAWLARAHRPVDPEPAKRRAAPAPVAAAELQLLMPAAALRVVGEHNALNALAALGLGLALGLALAPMLHGLRDYHGEAHRTALVRAIGGVDFIDDSKGTNVGATLAALNGLGRKVVLIAGGLGKGQDFSPLAKAVREHARAVVLIGADAQHIGAALQSAAPALHYAQDLAEAVAQAYALAQPGDAVLLSPACASMDMFRDYAHRGACFAQVCAELAADHGEVA